MVGDDASGAGDSLGVAAAVSLVCMALGRRPDPSVVMTGALGLTGEVFEVEGLAGKLQGCMARRARTLLVPRRSLDRFDAAASLPTEELRQYAERALRGYSTLLEALELAITGEQDSMLLVLTVPVWQDWSRARWTSLLTWGWLAAVRGGGSVQTARRCRPISRWCRRWRPRPAMRWGWAIPCHSQASTAVSARAP